MRRRKGLTAGMSDAAQDYLREIYKLQQDSEQVSTSALARRMQVSAPSATAMVKKLASLELAEHTPYRGVRLTPAGERIALEVIRHHRLLELYLTEMFESGLDVVHSEADRLEHALSEDLEHRIDQALGSPTHDPHGDPIPDVRLKVASMETQPLTALAPGEVSTVRRIPDGDSELLRYLVSLALVPGQPVTLVEAAPFGGPVTLRIEGRDTAISAELAARIQIAA
jgi:DtxR family Mn-dependent transcriptional regulator